MDLPIKEVEEMQCSRQKEEKGIPLNPFHGIYLDVSLIRIQTTEFHVQFIYNL